jgi:hypothetical protein
MLTTAAVDPLLVTLKAQPAMLAAVSVSASEVRRRQGIEDFHQRRIRGLGSFVTREEILARGATRPSDLLRSKPGVRIVRIRGGGQGLRFISAATFRRDCMPLIWLDGQRAPGMEIDELMASDLEGIELYAGPSTTPMQFSHAQTSSTCGTIVVWSRSPGS